MIEQDKIVLAHKRAELIEVLAKPLPPVERAAPVSRAS